MPRGKPLAISRIRQRNPYNTITMIGDGITDLEAVQVRAEVVAVQVRYRGGK
jgi:2-hydroxy-3-keto-5-methylthiopentenyl-1-phosphate phosphatase